MVQAVNAYEILVSKTVVKRQLERSRRWWEDNIKIQYARLFALVRVKCFAHLIPLNPVKQQ
jgi:hypothetical protein